MKLKNKSDSKIITVGGVSILPGAVAEVPDGFANNPLLKHLPVEVVKEKAAKAGEGDGKDIPSLIASIKNSKEDYVRKLCGEYGVPAPEGAALPDLKKALTDKLAELAKAGEGDGKTGEEN